MPVAYYREVNGKAKPKRRDPRGPRTVNPITITLCCDEDLRARLNAYAKKEKVTVSEAIRTFVEWGLEEEKDGTTELR